MISILQQLPSSSKPITKVIQSSDHFKVIAVGLNEGIQLKKHKAPGRAKIVVIEGTIRYTNEQQSIELSPFEEHDIPLEEVHEVTGIIPSIFLLIVG